jgi:hypothetical protein
VAIKIGAKENLGRGSNAGLAYLHEEGERVVGHMRREICESSCTSNTHVQLIPPTETFPHYFVQFYGQPPQERTRWQRRFEYAERGVLILHRMDYSTLGLPRHMLQSWHYKFYLRVHSMNGGQLTPSLLRAAVAKPPHRFLRNLDYW